MREPTEEETVNNLYIDQIIKDCEINLDEEIGLPPVAISLGEYEMYTEKGKELLLLPIGTYGNFSFISAPVKSKKTFFISLLAGTYLSGVNELCGDIKGHRVDEQVFYFDTEQGKWHVQNVLKRVIRIAGVKHKSVFNGFSLRAIGHRDRVAFIERVLSNAMEDGVKIGLVVIDGVADLISCPNEEEPSNNCVQKLMEWTVAYKCHISTVIHLAYGTKKPTGHLGSTLMKKAETHIRLEKNTVNEGNITVHCMDSRNYPFDTFSFSVNNKGLPYVTPPLYDVMDGVKM